MVLGRAKRNGCLGQRCVLENLGKKAILEKLGILKTVVTLDKIHQSYSSIQPTLHTPFFPLLHLMFAMNSQ